MCGIFGVTITPNSPLKDDYRHILKRLFLLSESRGKEASGFALNNGKQISYLKTPFPASDLVKSSVFENQLEEALNSTTDYLVTIGHSRLVTNGYEQYNDNNQPVVKNNMAVIHNGIIVNSSHLWRKYSDEKKKSDLDSELIPTLLRKFYNKTNHLQQSLQQLYAEIYGMTSVAILTSDLKNLILATNNGSLYYIISTDSTGFVFASERHILKTLIENLKNKNLFNKSHIRHLEANYACVVNLKTTEYDIAAIDTPTNDFSSLLKNEQETTISEITNKISDKPVYVNTSMEYRDAGVPEKFIAEVETRRLQIAHLKRCSRCILPETFPFIEFDENGICNYCNNYSLLKFKGFASFKELLNQYRSVNGSPDCLMPFSGGRDSSFALHFVKKELGMNPIAFSYDWGMLTDLARRNQSRMCGKLGIEHILVSADIRKKRENIKKNVLAWLKRPHLGTIPLFMAGDKQYFYFANLLMEQNNIKISVMGENMLETTRFKSGFCGIKPQFKSQRTYTLSQTDKIKMLYFYGKEYLLNPAYINSSLLDTVDSFKSYYIIKHQNINIFDYIPWEEEKIERVLIDEYDWETDPGTRTTWRIGDGTAAFYNYIYYMVAGFTENDTFRSNQIREGLLTRQKAFEKANEENNPRWSSIQWYCNTINVDFQNSIAIINKIDAIYQK